ncbi:MAG TPA: hypothetical protein VEW91_01680 [bacterium]|nr:hypothetical protein [bacterium]
MKRVRRRPAVRAKRRAVRGKRRAVRATRRGVRATRRGVRAKRRAVRATRRGVRAKRPVLRRAAARKPAPSPLGQMPLGSYTTPQPISPLEPMRPDPWDRPAEHHPHEESGMEDEEDEEPL